MFMKINNFHLNFLPFSKFKYTKKQQLDIFMVRVSKMDWMRHKWIFIEKIETWKSFWNHLWKSPWGVWNGESFQTGNTDSIRMVIRNCFIRRMAIIIPDFHYFIRFMDHSNSITLRNCFNNRFNQSICFLQ